MIGVTILGSTGTIGENTLDVIARNGDRCRVVALGANVNDQRMAEQCAKWRPEAAVMADADAAERLRARLRADGVAVEVYSGVAGLARIAGRNDVDTVMAAIVGAAGLEPALAAVRAGKRVLLASKEALVMSGKLFMDATRENRAELLPIDSEHNAIFQCMPTGFVPGYPQGNSPRIGSSGARMETPATNAPAGRHGQSADSPCAVPGIRRILLTASGGPFRNLPSDAFETITPEQACAHPNWVMGKKISVDSATMMNKGLELIEACWLFDATPDRIQVVVHPQSVIHSMVEYIDGSVLAQMGNPDMRTPIAHALFWPARVLSGVDGLDIMAIGRLDFEPADLTRFPCLRLGYEVAGIGGTAPAIMNAANEIAVAAFLAREIPFTAIYRVIETTLARMTSREAGALETVLEDDAAARGIARDLVGKV
ncbi:MAG: 1-deoxy-D-xylulose 5-phosphate reductoisomerase [Candidatus Kentron sp. G]|nr:MAG: 1-deoxy-D-xylulose 5-phosphate reductoisomerase [Candidatus Kentron sp. G]VFM95601.1 MAG: 1-deoxy-D-xylulose 5-phosphate reductoisomerase [Candidatus Kentron sp. G]VFM97232.1 MAG: 1-deoxy-D-xylulose 5-phosphate reductoisomerase [Candidatus Kentron sp. G]